MTRRRLFMGSMIMLVTWFIGNGGETGIAAPEGPAPNRAGLARATASSVRLARLEEIPRTKNVAANVKLAAPNLRPRWVARYAIDGSPLTRWASAEDVKELPSLTLAVGTPVRPRVMVSGLVIAWGADFPARYQIMVGSDGDYWKPAFQQENCPGGIETVTFSGPVPARALRIEVRQKSASSIEIIDLRIFGDPAEAAPADLRDLKAVAAGPDHIDLRWAQDDETTAFYRVFRAEGVAPKPTPEFQVAVIGVKEYADRGLKPGREYHYLVAPETYGGRAAAPQAASARTAAGEQFARFPLRGIVEGFYNDPWPHQERLRMIEFLDDYGFNYYIYAPKLDAYHRQLWREPYPAAERHNFVELLTCAHAHGIAMSYGISPGLDIDRASAADVKLLQDKLKAMFDVGFRSFTLCLDDIPGDESAGRVMGEGQARLVNQIFKFLRGLDPTNDLIFVPTVYSHTPSWWKSRRQGAIDYLAALAALDPAIGIMWTGPDEVFSVHITREEAAELARMWSRKILLWDNYPVNDVTLRYNVFTGPYLGRAPDLDAVVNGVMLNPMYLPGASKVALFTAGAYMTRRDYDPWAAYEEALTALAPDDAGRQALKAVSDCLTPHPVFPELSIERTPIYIAVADFWRTNGSGPDAPEAVRLKTLLALYAAAPQDLRDRVEPSIADDLMPPAEKLSLYGQAGLKCLELLSTRDPDRQAALRAEVLRLQAAARLNPWLVADERTTLSARYLGGRILTRNVLDDFITRALATVRP